MNPNDVIETYVTEVARRVPAKERNDIALELRDLLTEMLTERAAAAGRVADDAMVLAMLRDFGMPAAVAARYRPPGVVIIPAGQTQSFAVLSLGGVVLQWALTLPGVFAGQPLTAWWFSWGLGAFWWPGLMVTCALLAAGMHERGWWQPVWRPRTADPDRVNRIAMVFGLVWFAVGVVFMLSLPWIAGKLPEQLEQVFAFHPGFLQQRAWPALLLWLGVFAVRVTVCARGRWMPLTRRLDMLFGLAWIALMVWWIAAGDIFQSSSTNDGAKGALCLGAVFIVFDLLIKLYRRRTPIHLPRVAG
ncbi:MAG: hypothetical protein ABI178_03320 [Rhodanobacter sp.]